MSPSRHRPRHTDARRSAGVLPSTTEGETASLARNSSEPAPSEARAPATATGERWFTLPVIVAFSLGLFFGTTTALVALVLVPVAVPILVFMLMVLADFLLMLSATLLAARYLFRRRPYGDTEAVATPRSTPRQQSRRARR